MKRASPIHHVKCRVKTCRVPLERTTHWRSPICAGCSRRADKGREAKYTMRIRQEARRYRILLSVGPYRTYEELLKALKVRNPHLRELNYDMTLERRVAG